MKKLLGLILFLGPVVTLLGYICYSSGLVSIIVIGSLITVATSMMIGLKLIESCINEDKEK